MVKCTKPEIWYDVITRCSTNKPKACHCHMMRLRSSMICNAQIGHSEFRPDAYLVANLMLLQASVYSFENSPESLFELRQHLWLGGTNAWHDLQTPML